MTQHTKAWLEKAIKLAAQLGFWDDVIEYKKELRKLEKQEVQR